MRPVDVPGTGKERHTGSGYPDLTWKQLFELAQLNGKAFIDAYIPIVERNKSVSWTEEDRYWQEIRRGRYVEFNLILIVGHFSDSKPTVVSKVYL